jgi:hypothetical protein
LALLEADMRAATPLFAATPYAESPSGLLKPDTQEEAVPDRREAVAEDLRALAEDLKSLLESATTDPKERQRKERRWRALYTGLGVVTTLAARRLATKAWAVLTGEQPPAKGAAQATPSTRAAAERQEEAAEERVHQEA